MKIRQREELYKKQADQLSRKENKEVEKLNKQIEELEKKEAALQAKKDEEKKRLKEQYEQSLKDQVEKKRMEKEKERQENEAFKETWKSKLSDLHNKESAEEKFRKELIKKNEMDLKRQMDEKQRQREANYRRELEEADKVKAHLEDQEDQFRSYAEKCTKEWSDNGKNLYPIIKHLSSTMKKWYLLHFILKFILWYDIITFISNFARCLKKKDFKVHLTN